jgi:Family of unknown function (DUF6134)
MTRLNRWGAVFTQAVLCTALMLAGDRALAADGITEQRDFSILVDGDPAGNYSMSITQRDDGSQTMSAAANVRVKYLAGLKVYRYSYRGTETWKAGRLIHFTSTSNDDGKEFTVSAIPDSGGLRLRVNGRERFVRADIWLTTYWHLADPKFRNQGVPLVDADTGQDLAAQLQYVETKPMELGGQVQNCTHYRILGDTQAELWYDSQERLVRMISWSEGHRYELSLTRIRR